MKIVMLEAAQPLTKTFTKTKTEITKTPYPMTWEFTSHELDVANLPAFRDALVKHASLGHCVLKGTIKRPLVAESRAGSTTATDQTEWLVLDLDGIPDKHDGKPQTIQTFLDALGVGNVSHIIQWSASQGIFDNALRAHVFFMLDRPMAAPLLKQWLIQKNHEVPFLRDAMELTKSNNSIRWPLDISACQNDKLIYIAPPLLKGVKDPFAKQPRIQLVKAKHERLSISSAINSTEKNRALTHARLDELRDAAGLPKRKFTYKSVAGTEVMIKPDSCVITDMKTERGFTYFNLNGGDSWAYYHPEDKPDYIYNFKGEPTYLTKELLPDYWQQITSSGVTRTSSSGVIYLAFCDRRSSTYWRGFYDPTNDKLDITQAKNETQLRHFCAQYGIPIGDFVPEWDLTFDPHSSTRVDFQNRVVNRFQASPYMLNPPKPVTACPPTIFKVLHHAVGEDVDVSEHFINWLAFIIQRRDRAKTAWVLHGTQGCLAAETQIEFNRGKRNGGRPLPIKDAYAKWTGKYKLGKGLGKAWDINIPTRAKSVRDGMTIGYHEVFKIVESGEKQLYRLTASNGFSIRITEHHPIMRPDGSMTPLNELKPGDEIIVEGPPINHIPRGGRNKQRATVYSIPYHPHAWQHIINGKNYKRSHRARLVVEADMNAMSLDEFIDILRTDPLKAATLQYLADDVIVHHVDEDPTNDTLSNLEVIDKINHDAHHAKEVGMGYISTKIVKVKSIKLDKVEMTYDMVMKAPYHNYIANGFAVSNTGKGILTNNVLRPLFHPHTASRRMEELNEKYNHFMADALLVFIDETQIKALGNEKGVMAKIKNFITEELVPIRVMHANAIEARNYSNWIFMSNMPDPVMIDKGDRRFNVGRYQPKRLEITDQEIARIERELQAFHDFLMGYPMDPERARQVINTSDRDNMIALTETSVDTVSNALDAGDFSFFIDQLPTDESHKRNALALQQVNEYVDVLKALMTRTDAKGVCNISREELRTLFDYVVGNIPRSPNKFTSLLKHHRVHIQAVWVDNKTVRGLPVTWKDHAQFGAYAKQHFGAGSKVK